MNTWMYIVIALAVIFGLLIPNLAKRAAGKPILKIKIGSTDGFIYVVQLKDINTKILEVESIRAVLHFIAKMLYVIPKEYEYVAEDILEFIEKLSLTEISQKDIIELTPSNISIQEGFPSGRVIEGVLYLKNIKVRNLITKLPLSNFEYQLYHSVVALITITSENLNDYHRVHLKNSLKAMSDSFKKGANPKDIRTHHVLPNIIGENIPLF